MKVYLCVADTLSMLITNNHQLFLPKLFALMGAKPGGLLFLVIYILSLLKSGFIYLVTIGHYQPMHRSEIPVFG